MFFQEITLLDQQDVDVYHVYSSVYAALHHALCNNEDGDVFNIGLSFPEYHYNAKTKAGGLGRKIRLFARTKKELELLAVADALSDYIDYAQTSKIESVGDKVTHYEIYTRYRYKRAEKRAEKLQAHLIKTKGEEWYKATFDSFDAVVEHCESTGNAAKNLPHICLASTTNNQQYIIGFERAVVDTPTNNFSFNDYGLSKKTELSTVPAW